MTNIGGIIDQITGNRPQWPQNGPPMPQQGGGGMAPVQKTYPPVPAIKNQDKPTKMALYDIKYNAFNVDQVTLNITNRKGFDGVTPDLIIWNQYQYNVTDIQANANEKELSGYVNWAMSSKGIQDLNIDFHPGQQVTVSGKYPLLGLPLPFTAEVSTSLTPDKKLLLTVTDFKTGFSVPGKLRDALLNLFVGNNSPANAPPPDNMGEAFAFGDALQKVGPNQILVDFSRMKVPVNMPLDKVETTEEGIRIQGGPHP